MTTRERERGEALATRGDPAKNIPACAACHGKAFGGMQPAIPGLVGLNFDYIAAQLCAWKTGARRANAPDCMHEVATRLVATDISAVAKWLAARQGTVASGRRRKPRRSCRCRAAARRIDDGRRSRRDVAARLALRRSPARRAGGDAAAAATAPRASAAPMLVARGEYLARAGDCVACHTVRGGQPFAGGLEMPTPFGTLYHAEHHAGPRDRHRQVDRRRLLAARCTRARAGRLAALSGVPVPELHARHARRRRRDVRVPQVAAGRSRKKNPPHGMGFPYNQRKLLNGWRALYFEPGEYENAASQTAEWNRGAYLVQGLGHCDACHTGRNMLGATRKGAAFAGGVMPVQEWYAPSLTSNRESGLGQWDVDDIVALLHTGVSQARRGVRPDGAGRPRQPAVPDRARRARDGGVPEVAAAAAATPREPPPDAHDRDARARRCTTRAPSSTTSGAPNATSANGAGMPPTYPPLANNQSIAMEFPVNPMRMVMFGGFPPATRGNPRPYGMPPFAQTLSNEEIAAVVTYIRQSWGNRAAPVSPADVDKFRTVPLE